MILESLFFLLQADSSEFNSEMTKAGKSVDKTKEKMESGDKIREKFSDGLRDVAKEALGIVTVFATLGKAIDVFGEAKKRAIETDDAARKIGIETKMLGAWEGAAQDAGVSADEFRESILKLSENMKSTIAQMAGHFNMMMPLINDTTVSFKQLGISLKGAHGVAKDMDVLLPQLAAKFSKMSEGRAQSIGQRLGLSYKTIDMLRMGSAKIADLIKQNEQYGVSVAKTAELARQFDKDHERLNKTLDMAKMSFGDILLPLIDKAITSFVRMANFFESHGAVVKTALAAIGGAILYAVVPAITAMTTSMLPAVAVFAAAAAPFAILGGLAAILVKLFNDLSTYSEMAGDGVKSAGGSMSFFGNIIQDVTAILKSFGDIAGALFSLLSELIENPVETLEVFKQTIDAVFADFINWLQQPGAFLSDLEKQITDTFENLLHYLGLSDQGIKAIEHAFQAAFGNAIALASKFIGYLKQAGSAVGELIGKGADVAAKTTKALADSAKSFAEQKTKQIDAEAAKRIAFEKKKNAMQSSNYNKNMSHEKQLTDAQAERMKQQQQMNMSLDRWLALWAAQRGKDAGMQNTGGVTPGQYLARRQQAMNTIPMYGGRVATPQGQVALRNVGRGQNFIHSANNNQLNTMSNSAIANSASSGQVVSKNVNVNVGDVNIHTQATDPKQIAQSVSNHLQEQLVYTLNQNDDGVHA